MNADRSIGIAGAGSIGCFVGGMLAASGRRVALLARPRLAAEIEVNGLRLTNFDGSEQRLDESQLTLSDDPSIFGDVGTVLVTVKSADTAEMADIIARHAPADVVVVSLQNGVGNVSVLRERLPGRRVLGGMVPFNVVGLGEGRFHRSTSGDIVVEQDEAATFEKLSVPGLNMRATTDIEGVQWGKLIVNLNNALNALSDIPLRQQLAQRAWRRLFADQMAEGLAAIKAEGIRPVSPTPIPPSWMPPLLRLPDAIFGMLLGRTVKIDPAARSSMWEDLQRGRHTEIDYLQGVITGIAHRRGLTAPLSRRIVELIKQAEVAGKGSPGLTPEQVRGDRRLP
jgi:2-dehydropantoate 2-reductase